MVEFDDAFWSACVEKLIEDEQKAERESKRMKLTHPVCEERLATKAVSQSLLAPMMSSAKPASSVPAEARKIAATVPVKVPMKQQTSLSKVLVTPGPSCLCHLPAISFVVRKVCCSAKQQLW